MKLKIISDGTTVGTKLINEETGEMVGLVQNIQWEVGVGDNFASATVRLIKVPVELNVDAEIFEEIIFK